LLNKVSTTRLIRAFFLSPAERNNL
jgi:hypothetical protein